MGHANFAFQLIVQIALGVSLAACAGIRAFLPLLAASILVRTGHIQFGESFAWLGSTPALVIFGVATVAEILGDKFPAVDHFLDSTGVVVKPIAATILFSMVIVKIDPVFAIVLGLIVGGSLSEVIHIKKAELRLASSALTGGLANPVISAAEDIGALLGVIFSIVAPLIAVVVVLVGIYVAFRIYSKYVARKKKKQKKMELEEARA